MVAELRNDWAELEPSEASDPTNEEGAWVNSAEAGPRSGCKGTVRMNAFRRCPCNGEGRGWQRPTAVRRSYGQ